MNLDLLHEKLRAYGKTMLGYPLNCNPLPIKEFYRFLDRVINNLGDPFVGSNCKLETFEIEKKVVGWFAELFNLENYWGYVTNCGSEGCFQGIATGMQKYPDAIVYYSNRAHYSVAKAAKLMGREAIVIETDAKHKINLNDFKSKLKSEEYAVVCLTAGTTMAGAIDDVRSIINILQNKGIKYYIHVDAALFGLLTPFTSSKEIFDFRLDIDSISVSGHKMLGAPIPCGVFVSRKTESEIIQYIGSNNSTLFGSRDGFSSIILWYYLSELKKEGIKQLVTDCLINTSIGIKLLSSMGWEAWKHDNSNIIVIRKPPEILTQKWQLAVHGNTSHIVVMPHVTVEMLEKFVSDLKTLQKVA